MNEKNTLSVRQMFVLFLLFLGVPSLPLLVPEAAHIGKNGLLAHPIGRRPSFSAPFFSCMGTWYGAWENEGCRRCFARCLASR